MKILPLSSQFALAALAIFFNVTAPNAVAQVASTGSVQGSILDQTGAAIPDASAVLTNAATAQKLAVRSNASGEFSFPVLPVGRYTLTVSKAASSPTPRQSSPCRLLHP